MTNCSRSVLKLAALLIIVAALSSCKNTSVYGSVGVGVGYGSGGFNGHHGGSRMRGSISVGGRIR
jgi:predicted porin